MVPGASNLHSTATYPLHFLCRMVLSAASSISRHQYHRLSTRIFPPCCCLGPYNSTLTHPSHHETYPIAHHPSTMIHCRWEQCSTISTAAMAHSPLMQMGMNQPHYVWSRHYLSTLSIRSRPSQMVTPMSIDVWGASARSFCLPQLWVVLTPRFLCTPTPTHINPYLWGMGTGLDG